MLTTDLPSWLAMEKRLVDDRLATLLPAADTFPAPLHQAMRAGVLNGGKRLRAILLRGLCTALGGDPDAGTTAGCAVELYHAATLVLDDLPCMDDAATRRGHPALHLAYDEATAVLAAEALMMRAIELLSRPGQEGLPPNAPAAALVAHLSSATGSAGLMAGQHLDLMYESRPADLETLEAIHSRKTGRLFQFCAEAAGLLVDAPADQREVATGFAAQFGLAFQISDDLLDATGDAAALGKPTGQDAAVGKSTYATHFGVAGAREQLATATTEAQKLLGALPGDAAPLHALAELLLRRTT